MFSLHLRYLFNRFNIITILVVIALYLGILLINIFSIPLELNASLSQKVYFSNMISILKLLVVLLIVFLFSLSSLSYNDSYQLYLISKRKQRIKYYVTKISALISVSIGIVLIMFIFFILWGLLFTNWYVIKIDHVKFFVYLGLVGIMYGLFSYNLIKLLNSLIVVIIPCIIIILEEAFINEKFIVYLSYLFPMIKNNNGISLSYGVIQVIILIFCYFIWGLIKNYTVDIK